MKTMHDVLKQDFYTYVDEKIKAIDISFNQQIDSKVSKHTLHEALIPYIHRKDFDVSQALLL